MRAGFIQSPLHLVFQQVMTGERRMVSILIWVKNSLILGRGAEKFEKVRESLGKLI